MANIASQCKGPKVEKVCLRCEETFISCENGCKLGVCPRCKKINEGVEDIEWRYIVRYPNQRYWADV